MSKVRVLFIGQTPPPFGGQAVANAAVAGAKYEKIEIVLLRLKFSRQLSEIGRFQIRKMIHFASIVMKAVWLVLVKKPRVVCYPPSNGENKFPFLRDVVFLFILRSLFPKKRFVWVFHAARLSEFLDNKPARLKGLFGFFVRRALFNPQAGVAVSHHGPPDARYLRAQKEYSIPNGIPDLFPADAEPKTNAVPQLLFMGVICEEKGVSVLVEACREIKQKGFDFELTCAGEFSSPAYRREMEAILEEYGLTDRIHFPGVVTGEAKINLFLGSDIFSFPSHAPYESFGLVVAEAMMFELPVVATKWSGIQDLVEDGETGFMVPIKNSSRVAEALEKLFRDADLRHAMGKRGRARYLSRFQLDRMIEDYESMFREVGAT